MLVMFQKKSTKLKQSRNRSILDQVLYFIENYLPQKNKRASKELSLNTLEAETLKQIKKFASVRSKSFTNDLTNTKVTFTIGSWALPYLNFLKRTGLLK